MSSNYQNYGNRRGGGGGGGGGNSRGNYRGGGNNSRGGGSSSNRRNYNNRNYNNRNNNYEEGTNNQSLSQQQQNPDNNNPVTNETSVVTTVTNEPTVTTVNEVSSTSSSSSTNSGDSTGVFNTADEGSILGDKTVQEISSEEDEDTTNSEDNVVNASLIVNLSKSEVLEERVVSPYHQRGSSSSGLNVPEIVLIEPSPLKEDKMRKSKLEDSSSDDDIIFVEEIVKKVPTTMVTKIKQEPAEKSPQEDKVPVPNEEESSSDDDDDLNDSEDSEVEKLMLNQNLQNVVAKKHPIDSSLLPNTVTVLTARNGVVVYLVGTAHFSHQSQVDVANTIQLTQPTIVLLELCSSRKNILELDEETILREVSEMNFQKIRLALSNGGTVQGTLHLLLLSMSAQLTKKLGMAPGGEFRVAAREARKIPGNVVLLGDRPFNITIARALASLTFFQKMKLAWQFITCNEDITREEIEKCKEKDLLERMLSEMTGEFPSITEVFVNERDVYLAHSLYLAATSDAHRSNGGPVVGVVGMGHVAGIVRNWGGTDCSMVNRVIKIPETPLSSIIIRKSFKILFYGVIGYSFYKVGKRIGLVDFGGEGVKKIGGNLKIGVDKIRNLYL